MATKKKLKKMIAEHFALMPKVNTLTQEQHIVTGSELLEQGHFENAGGEKVNKDATYNQMMPVIVQDNHDRRIKRAFKKGGRDGVTQYLKSVNKTVANN